MLERNEFFGERIKNRLPSSFSISESPETTIEQHFLFEPIARKAERTSLSQIPKAYEIEKYGTLVKNPDELASQPTETVSPTDTSDKFTHDVDTCLTVIPAGCTSDENNVSKLFHLTPKLLIDADFETRFIEKLNEFKNNLNDNKPSTVIAGGLFIKEKNPWTKQTYKDAYKGMLIKVSKGIKDALGVEPVVVPPKRKNNYNLTHVYYATKDRALIIVETGEISEPTAEIFPAGRLKNVSKYWD